MVNLFYVFLTKQNMLKMLNNNFKFLSLVGVVLISLFTFSCSDLEDPTDKEVKDGYTFDEIKQLVEKDLQAGHVFYWDEQPVELLLSAGNLSDSMYSIGYNIRADYDVSGNMHKIDLASKEWENMRTEILELILEEENVGRTDMLTDRDIQPFGVVKNFPQIIIETSNLAVLKKLRESNVIRYIEPIGFSISDNYGASRSSSGCSGNPNYGINPLDYVTESPTAKVPWNFYKHNIDDAWTNSNKGDNIKVCIIDTGASDSQDNLGSNFNSGNSINRTVEKYSTKYSGKWWWKSLDSPHDPCGHGTSMAGQATGPWSNDGNALGVAYLGNLVSVRAVEDVIISTSNERAGVRDALYLAGSDGAIKVVSMSIGTPFYSGTVADGIYYAYNQGKLLMAAAGTSLPWTNWYPVIFPANMSQTVAITGVKDSDGLQECETCHTGGEVDFVIIMERANDDDRNSLGLATYSNQPKYIGGSSSGTSTAAGIATMVWSENPSASRNTIMSVLKNASSIYPARHNDFGWGLIDANQAVTGL